MDIMVRLRSSLKNSIKQTQCSALPAHKVLFGFLSFPWRTSNVWTGLCSLRPTVPCALCVRTGSMTLWGSSRARNGWADGPIRRTLALFITRIAIFKNKMYFFLNAILIYCILCFYYRNLFLYLSSYNTYISPIAHSNKGIYMYIYIESSVSHKHSVLFFFCSLCLLVFTMFCGRTIITWTSVMFMVKSPKL